MTMSLRLLKPKTKSGIFRKSEAPYRNIEIEISPTQRIELEKPIQANALKKLRPASFIISLPDHHTLQSIVFLNRIDGRQ